MLLPGEEHSSHSGGKRNEREREGEMLPRRGCQLGAYLIEYAMPFEVVEYSWSRKERQA